MSTTSTSFKKEAASEWQSQMTIMARRRYRKWSVGQVPIEDKFLDKLAKAKAHIVTSWRLIIKNLLDFCVALIGVVLTAPIMALIAIAIKLESQGPILYRQTRVGKKGKPFPMYKFRSMQMDAERASGPVWARENDGRVTSVGSFLRQTHLDELPQLLNVLRGEMSIVGPRPERPFFVEKFRKTIPHYDRRHVTKPGITGLAQTKRGYDVTLADVRKKLRYDVLYIQKMCPILDVKVIGMTFLAVVLKTGR